MALISLLVIDVETTIKWITVMDKNIDDIIEFVHENIRIRQERNVYD